jgi:hypothetical protein
MKKILLGSVLMSPIILYNTQMLLYKNPQLIPQEQAADLLSRMTPDEKTGLL